MSVYEIPLSATPQTIQVALAGITYSLRFFYADDDEAGWCMDISDAQDEPMICGIPLITGADLLAQYAYLGFGGKLYVLSDGPDRGAVPTFDNLGTSSHLYFEPN